MVMPITTMPRPGFGCSTVAVRLLDMRRYVLVLLLSLLPVQFSWASVAAYCMHEKAPAQARHLGHHEHQHQVLQADEKTVNGDKIAIASDLDCCFCHGLGLGMLLPVVAVQISAEVATLDVVHPSAVRTMAPIPPERPQWRVLA